MNKININYKKLHLYFLCTCGACPEQYDVYNSQGKQCGYVRLRWGSLRAYYPDIDGVTIYFHEFSDNFKGCFDFEERVIYIKEIANALKNKIMGNALKNKIMEKVPIEKNKLDVEVHFINSVEEIPKKETL